MEKKEGRLFCCGDTHGTSDLSKIRYFEDDDLTKKDVLIQLGDFGGIWYPINDENQIDDFHYCRVNEEQNELLEYWARRNYTVAIVLGNHENYSAIDNLPWIEKWGGEVQVVKMDHGEIYILKRGGIYTINGKKILAVSGAFSIDRGSRRKYVSWWPQEDINKAEEDFCLDEIDKHDRKVDYVLTHTYPESIIEHFAIWNVGYVHCPTSIFLDEVDNLVERKEWHGGHMHVDRVYEETTLNGDVLKYFCHFNASPYELK